MDHRGEQAHFGSRDALPPVVSDALERYPRASLITYSESDVNLLLGHVGTGEMHAGLDSDQALAGLHHLGGQIGRSSTCIPVGSYQPRSFTVCT